MTALVDNIERVADNRWRERAACRDHPQTWWFPVLGDGGDNHGTKAKAVCAECPVRHDCLTDSLTANVKYGIAGGAGEDERRWLHRAWTTDGPDGPVWAAAELEHFSRLSGAKLRPADRNGPHATCGLAVTYSRGHICTQCGPDVAPHRCPTCEIAASLRGAAAKRDRRWRRSRAA